MVTIKDLWDFRKAKIVDNKINLRRKEVFLDVAPDRRFKPVCAHCGSRILVHQHGQRLIRDMPLWGFSVFINAHYRKGFCSKCGKIVVERLEYTKPGLRITSRLAEYILGLGKKMSDADIARSLGLSWKVVHKAHYEALLDKYGNMDYGAPRLLAVKDRLTDAEMTQLEHIFGTNEALYKAYTLKDMLHAIFNAETADEALDRAQMFIRMAIESKIKPIRDFAATLFKNIRYIVNHAKYKITTAIAEGMINKIKNIKRRAYGIKDLQYLRLLATDAFY